jgi:molybdopterin-guanine dinucleotide biosynthesis protein MobB
MPFADPALAGMMAGVATGYDAVVPISPAGIEPLFALYKRSCLDTMADFIQREELKIISVLEHLDVHWVAPADMRGLRDPSLTFFNVNTPEELAQAEGMLSAIGEEARGSRDTQEPPLVCFVGNKDSGKTTFLEKLVAHLTALGLRVACIKHDSHGFQMDHEGTDTWRLAEAGARRVVISSPERLAMIARDDMEADLGELTDLVGASVDIILAEGYKRSDGDKIEVQGNGAAELVCPEEELLAVISDETPRGVSLPVFDRSNAEPVAEFIIERYGLKSIIAEEGH